MAKTQEQKEAGLLEAIKKMTIEALDKVKVDGFSAAVPAAIEQRRAELAAKKDAEEADLLTMNKDGEKEIRVHPTQVGPWQKQGWSVKE